MQTLRTMKSYLDRGCFIVAGASVNAAQNSGWTGFIGHAFLVSGVNLDPASSGYPSVEAYDPTFCEGPGRNTGGKRTFVNVTSLGSANNRIGCRPDGICGWYFAFAVCK